MLDQLVLQSYELRATFLLVCLAVLGLHCGTQAFLVVVHRLSCLIAHGILVPPTKDQTRVHCSARPDSSAGLPGSPRTVIFIVIAQKKLRHSTDK